MKKLKYTYEQKRRASTLLSLCLSELEAAEILVEQELFREAVVHLYFCSFYASQAILVKKIKVNASHKSVDANLHKHYGTSKALPRRYVELHSFLHELRIEHSYKKSYIPNPRIIRRKLGVLQYYVKIVFSLVPKIDTLEIIDGIYQDNEGDIRDISYDIYCPKTYSHHTRITFWQPPFYRTLYSPETLCKHAKRMLKSIKVRRTDDYVVGLNSRLDQYKGVHLILLDIDSLDASVESALKDIGGILLKSGRGFHFIGKQLILGQHEWEKTMRKLSRHKVLKHCADKDHIAISLRRGYATLRITASKVKPRVPVFYKEI